MLLLSKLNHPLFKWVGVSMEVNLTPSIISIGISNTRMVSGCTDIDILLSNDTVIAIREFTFVHFD